MKLLRTAAASLVVAAFGIADAAPSLAWSRTYSHSLQDQTIAVARDTAGSVYLLGRRTLPATNVDWVLMKVSLTGALVWTRVMDGAAHGPDYPMAMTIDKFNQVWVVGSEKYLTGDRAVVVKYSPAGVQLRKVWMNKAAAGYDAFYSVASDPLGNVTMTGTMNRPGTGRDFVTLKLSQTGVMWYRYWTTGGNLPDEGRKVLVDGYGNAFVGGTYSATPDNLNRNVVLLKYSSAGSPVWLKVHTGPTTNDELSDMIFDLAGNPILAVKESKGTYSTFSVHKRLASNGNITGALFRYPFNAAWQMHPRTLVRDSLGTYYLATTHEWRSGETTYSRTMLDRFSPTSARLWERYLIYGGVDALASDLLMGPSNNPILFATLKSKTTPASQMRVVRYTPAGGLAYNLWFGRTSPATDMVADVAALGTGVYVGGTGKPNPTSTNYDFTLFRLNNL